MVARVEPSRARPPAGETPGGGRYPGLTAEERGLEPQPPRSPTAEPDDSLALWVAPAEVAPASRSSGFFGGISESPAPPPPSAAAEPEGLFDVPGLLERLWLARALEAGRDRPWASYAARKLSSEPPPPVLVSSPSAGPPVRAPLPRVPGPAAPAASVSPPRPVAPLPPNGPPTPARVAAAALWGSWICPQCYLTNDRAFALCRGCHRPAPRW